jgi:hypothetical protein
MMKHSNLICTGALIACLTAGAQFALGDVATWNRAGGGVPQGGDDIVLPAGAPNQNQTAISVGNVVTPLNSLTLQGGGYVIGNPSATLIFGTLISSTGNNTIQAAIFHQNQVAYVSNGGTLTFDSAGTHEAKDLFNMSGNGTIVFNDPVAVNGGNRIMDVTGTVTLRFNDALGGLTRVFSNNRAGGARVQAGGTVLVNGGSPATGNPSNQTNVWSITDGATLGGNGTLFATSCDNIWGSGIIGIGYRGHTGFQFGDGTLSPGDPIVNGGIGTLNVTATYGVKFGGQGAATVDPQTGTVFDSGTSTGTFLVQLGHGTTGDRLNVTGNIDLSSSFDVLQLNILPGANQSGDYVIATYTGTLTGVFNTVFLGASDITASATSQFMINDVRYRLDYGTGSNSQITLVALPEPAGALVLTAGALVVAGRRRACGS